MKTDDAIERLVNQSMDDVLYQEAKAMSGGIPFSGSGFAGGAPIYSSMDAWDRTIDSTYGMGPNSPAKYINKVGDLSHSSLIMSAVRFLGNVLPEAPLVVRENKTDEGETGQKGESITIADHPFTKLWNRPNKYYSGSTLKKAIAFSWVLRSEAYLIKNFNKAGTAPIELWYEPHWSIRPRWPIDGSDFISYYEVNRNGSWLPIPIENVIHLRDGLNPYDQRSAMSGIPSILRELFGDNEAGEYYANLMGGSAIPPFFVSIDKEMQMKQDDIDNMTSMIKRKTTGDRRGEPIAVKGGKAYKLAFTPRELDLRESRYMPEDRFCAVMGIPAVVLELGSGQAHSIYNNVQQAVERAWYSYVIPLLKHIQEELTVQLLEDFEGEDSKRYLEHDLSKVQALQEDEDAKATRLGGLFESGIIMRSEARSQLKYGPSDPAKPDVDKVFRIATGVSLVKPGEEMLGHGEVPIGPDGQPLTPGAPAPIDETPLPGETPEETQARIDKAKAEQAAKPPAPAEKPPAFIVKALASGDELELKKISAADIQATIQWLKKHRMSKAAAMMQAKPLPVSTNGDKPEKVSTQV